MPGTETSQQFFYDKRNIIRLDFDLGFDVVRHLFQLITQRTNKIILMGTDSLNTQSTSIFITPCLGVLVEKK